MKRKNGPHQWTVGIVCAVALVASRTAHAGQEQQPVSVQGTIALDGTVEKTYAAANVVIVKASDGIRHLFHTTHKTVVHGADAAGADALKGLQAGTHVVVHYSASGNRKTAVEVDRIGDRALTMMEGVVTGVSRETRMMSVTLADGSKQTLRLTERAAADTGADVDRAAVASGKVIIYYADESGERVAHYFKRIS